MHHSPLRVEELVTSIQDKFNPYGKRAYEPGNKYSVSKVVVKAWLQEVNAGLHPTPLTGRPHVCGKLGQALACTDQQLICAGCRTTRSCRRPSMDCKTRRAATVQFANRGSSSSAGLASSASASTLTCSNQRQTVLKSVLSPFQTAQCNVLTVICSETYDIHLHTC